MAENWLRKTLNLAVHWKFLVLYPSPRELSYSTIPPFIPLVVIKKHSFSCTYLTTICKLKAGATKSCRFAICDFEIEGSSSRTSLLLLVWYRCCCSTLHLNISSPMLSIWTAFFFYYLNSPIKIQLIDCGTTIDLWSSPHWSLINLFTKLQVTRIHLSTPFKLLSTSPT